MNDVVKAFWKEQLEIRGYQLNKKQEDAVLYWLDCWTDDSFDLLSDAIGGAFRDCSIDEEVVYG